ncbi:MAG: extracellular solute-binding protein [Acidimicrobiia bacterium]|nr:extracellular solute-binding protein [Acidimicrobiia bacterium]
MQIDPRQPIPIYFQLKTLILEEILAGTYPPGSRLPTEHELCERLGVSRTPVSRALSELADEGVILRKRRSGSFVNPHWGPRPGARGELRVIVSDKGFEDQIVAAEQPPVGANVAVVPFADLRRTLTLAVAEGLAPDLAVIDSVWMKEMGESGFLWDLRELDEDWVNEELSPDLLPPFTATEREPVYGAVAEANVAGMWYRRDVLGEAGVVAPTSWNELITVSQAIADHDPSINPLVMPGGTRAGETTTYCLLALLATNAVTVFADGSVSLDSDGTVEALRLVRTLVETRLMPPEVVGYEWDRAIGHLARRRAAMSFGGSYEARSLATASDVAIDELDDIYGFVPMPAGPRGRVASVAGGMAYAVFRQTKRPHLALSLLKAAVSAESLARLARSTSKIPTRRSAVEIVRDEKPFVAQTAVILEQAFTRPETEMYHHVSLQLQLMLEHVITLQLPPAAAAGRASEHIGAITGMKVHHAAL